MTKNRCRTVRIYNPPVRLKMWRNALAAAERILNSSLKIDICALIVTKPKNTIGLKAHYRNLVSQSRKSIK